MNLRLQILLAITGVLLLFAIPISLYNVYSIRSATELGLDEKIEKSLRRSVENQEINRLEDADALRRYLQLKSLREVLIRQTISVSAVALILVFAIALATALWLSSRINRPLRALTEATKRIAEGQLEYRITIPSKGSAELSLLMKAFNQMASGLKVAAEELRMAEKKETWRQVARTVAHEIKNPLTPIKLCTQRLLKKYTESAPDFSDVLTVSTKTILSEIDNMERLVDAFHQYARLPEANRKVIDLKSIVLDSMELFRASTQSIEIHHSSANSLPVKVDAGQLKEAFVNIIKNSVEASAPGTCRIKIYCSNEKGTIVCRIQDNGPGISEENRPNLFVPYFTTKTEGNGIGLAMTERLISQNGGTIEYESLSEGGACFVIRFIGEGK